MGVARSRGHGRPSGARDSRSKTEHTETGIAVTIQNDIITTTTTFAYVLYNNGYCVCRPTVRSTSFKVYHSQNIPRKKKPRDYCTSILNGNATYELPEQHIYLGTSMLTVSGICPEHNFRESTLSRPLMSMVVN